MKTNSALLLALLLLPACVPPAAPMASAPPAPPTQPAPARDTSGTGYRESQQRLVSEWQWYGGN